MDKKENIFSINVKESYVFIIPYGKGKGGSLS